MWIVSGTEGEVQARPVTSGRGALPCVLTTDTLADGAVRRGCARSGRRIVRVDTAADAPSAASQPPPRITAPTLKIRQVCEFWQGFRSMRRSEARWRKASARRLPFS